MTFRIPYITPAPAPPNAKDATQANNPSLFTNPIPFAQYNWPLTKRVPSLLPRLHHTNPALFTNPIPTHAFDFSNPWRVANFLTPQPYNVALYTVTVVASPFAQYDWSKPFDIVSLPPSPISRNNLIFSEVPFAQYDWAKQANIPDWLPPSPYSRNPLIFSEVPFRQLDWSVLQRFRLTAVEPVAYNLALLNAVVVSAPFYQTDWSVTRKPNILQPDQQNYNLSLLTAVITAPFYQTSWPSTKTVPIVLSPVASLNLNLFTNPIPFAQLDWSKPQQPTPALYPFMPANLPLATAPIAPPFIPVDYSKPYFPRNQIDATQPTNLLNFTNPIPFGPYDWNITRFQIPRAPDQIYPNLVPYAPPAPSTTPTLDPFVWDEKAWRKYQQDLKRRQAREFEEERRERTKLRKQLLQLYRDIPEPELAPEPTIPVEKVEAKAENLSLIVPQIQAVADRLTAMQQRLIEDYQRELDREEEEDMELLLMAIL